MQFQVSTDLSLLRLPFACARASDENTGWSAVPLCLMLLILLSCPGIMASEIADPKLAKIVSGLKGEEEKVSEVKQQADQKADAVYAQARAKLVAASVAALKKSLEGNDDPAFKVTVYKTLLNIDPSEGEALGFFKAVGNLDEVLAEVAKNPLLPPLNPPKEKAEKRDTISISAVNSARMSEVFKLQEPYLTDGESLRFFDGGSLTLPDTPTGSFTIRFRRGSLGKLDDNVSAAFDKPRFQIRGVPVLASVHVAITRAIGVKVLDELLVSFNADTGAYAIFSDSGIVFKEGKLKAKKGAPLFEAADDGNQPWGSRISIITLSQIPHPLVMKKP